MRRLYCLGALSALLVACTPSPAGVTSFPGAGRIDAALAVRLVAARQSRRTTYEVRSSHRMPDGEPIYTNRLIFEGSPYLLQHAHNPVNWYPWGDEAFAEARRTNRPVLLSIGYSTCHWCHVMAEESFDDETVARLVNQRYVAIKVDREERPDLDGFYMSAVVRMTGSGGWPMTVWLTPDRIPFWAGTYFPPNDGERGVRNGFRTLLTKMADAYAAKPEEVVAAAQAVVRDLQAAAAATGAHAMPEAGAIEAAVAATAAQFDATNGGLRARQKFPSATPIRLLLRHHRRTRSLESLRMATATLDHMADGGLRDQLGGAFHRYATDPAWRVPHFEIMLYDNALLALAYLDAFQVTGTPRYGQIAREILEYLAAEMQDPDGGFWSASDADSAGADGGRGEGRYFTWTPAEIGAALGDVALASAAARYYGVTAAGDVDGRSVLRVADRGALAPEALAGVRARLRAARADRPHPPIDRKLVTAWNGLAISAFARAARVLDVPGFAEAARRSAERVLAHATPAERLPRRLVDAEPGPAAVLDDYACLVAGLLDLFEATGAPRWLGEARRLEAAVATRFGDLGTGAYFLTAADAEGLPVRERPLDDGAEPSGNSVMAMNELRLAALTADADYRRRGEQVLMAGSGLLASSPLAAGELLLALEFALDVPREIVLAVSAADAGAGPFLARLRSRFLPNHALVQFTPDTAAALAAVTPLAADKPLLQARTTAYVCERQICALPTTDPDTFAAQLERVAPLRPREEDAR